MKTKTNLTEAEIIERRLARQKLCPPHGYAGFGSAKPPVTSTPVTNTPIHQ